MKKTRTQKSNSWKETLWSRTSDKPRNCDEQETHRAEEYMAGMKARL